MQDPNYYNVLIAVAADCPVSRSVVPVATLGKTIAVLQFEMLVDQPQVYSQEDVLFESLAGPPGPAA